MSKRHIQALEIQQGACNPSAIALAIVEACREVRSEAGTVTRDPAIQLMAHQLAFVVGVSTDWRLAEYSAAARACEARTAEAANAS